MVDKNRVASAADKAKGAIKESADKITGDAKLKARKAKGLVNSAVGGAADAIKGKK